MSDGEAVVERDIAPKPSPDARQIVLVGLAGESRRRIGLAVARGIGRPLTDSRLLAARPAGAAPTPVDEAAAVWRALSGSSRVVFTCGIGVFAAPLDDDRASEDRAADDAAADEAVDDETAVQRAAELLTLAWVVWIESSHTRGPQVEVERARDDEQRRRAEAWCDHRVDATGLAPADVVAEILETWRRER